MSDEWTPDVLRVWRVNNRITEYQRGEDSDDTHPKKATREAMISSQPAGEGLHLVQPFLRTGGTHPELRRGFTAVASSLDKLAAPAFPNEPAGAALFVKEDA